MFRDLDPFLHAQVRLAIMSILINVKSADFSYLLENINTSKGNLSFQLSKLREAGYLEVKKSFKGSYPRTTCQITGKGIAAYESYVHALEDYLKGFKNNKE